MKSLEEIKERNYFSGYSTTTTSAEIVPRRRFSNQQSACKFNCAKLWPITDKSSAKLQTMFKGKLHR
eukprot:4513314-Amphidinium_carterae.1